MRKLRPLYINAIAIKMILIILMNTILPCLSFALTSGPSSPEFSSFEPVGTTDMVNVFTGDFTYNLPVIQIPGPDESSYSLSLSYHSGVNAEEEASWVGFGWTLSPGAINRNVKGFPDDHKNFKVDQYAISPLNWTSSVRGSVGFEFMGFDDAAKQGGDGTSVTNNFENTQKFSIGLNGSSSIRFNSNNGFARFNGYGITGSGKIGGMNLNAGFSVNSGASGTTYQPNFSSSPLVRLNSINNKSEDKVKLRLNKLQLRNSTHNYSALLSNYVVSSLLSSNSYTKQAQVADMYSKGDFLTTSGYDLSMGLGAKIAPINIAVQYGLTGSVHWSRDEMITNFIGRGIIHEDLTQNARLLHDYYEEQDNPYSAKVLFSQVPIGNFDNYNVTNDVISGTFKYYPHQYSEFYPNNRNSGIRTHSIGVDLNVGEGVTIGLNLGGTYQRASLYSEIDPLLRSIKQGIPISSKLSRFKFSGEKSEPIKRKGYYTSTNELLDSLKTSTKIKPILTNNSEYLSEALKHGTLDSSIIYNNAIGGFDITSTDGTTVKFAVPVLARKEVNLSCSITDKSQKGPNAKRKVPLKQTQDSNLSINISDVESGETLQGQIKNDTYITSYLISEIRKPNFIDINDNKRIDSSDIGSYTKFHYEQKWGRSKTKWYRWRTPYSGLDYRRGQISSSKDNMGSFASGEREVYYMKAIETPTHIAYFVTNKSSYTTHFSNVGGHKGQINKRILNGSQKERLDGYGALHVSQNQDSASVGNYRSSQDSEYLESIILFSKTDYMQPLRVVKFEYDYSLVNGLPNSSGKGTSSGKLTLTKVWFEGGGVIKSKTLPYIFDYAYKPHSEFAPIIKSEYPELFKKDGYPELPIAVQNPSYNQNMLDPWGFIMPYATERKRYEIDQRYQGPYRWSGINEGWRGDIIQDSLSTQFDPSAWQLKGIKLPSGGEILIQYEEKDYSYVQNRYPMAMTSLVAANETANSSIYWVEPNDLGFDPSKESSNSINRKLNRQCEVIEKYFKTTKPYFKFLYQLDQDHRTGPPNLDNCMSEYISGYANFKGASIDSSKIIGKKLIKIELAGGYNSDNSPRKACYDFYTTRKYGLWEGADCGSGYAKRAQKSVEKMVSDGMPAALVHSQFALGELYTILPQISTYKIPERHKVGAEINLSLSYLKLPMYLPKKGGGVRVKRLLTYDSGLSPEDAAIYGHEFNYTTLRDIDGLKEVISSGVATNEPQSNSEESPFKTYLESAPKGLLDKLLSGEEAQQFEGPIGNTLIKDASVGYSRVIIQSINKSLTGSGYSVKEFYTSKDYPIDMLYQVEENNPLFPSQRINKLAKGVEYTDISKPNPMSSILQNPPPISIGFFSLSTRFQEIQQSYTFRLNSMHGQNKSTTDYNGIYPNIDIAEIVTSDPINNGRIVSGTETEYFAPGEALPVVTPDMKLRKIELGVEEEIAKTNYVNQELTTNFGFEFDLAISFTLAITPSVGISNFGIASQYLKSMSMAKIVRYPAIQKSIKEYKNGIWIKQEFIAFDKQTGSPIFVAVTDDADDGTNTSMDISMTIPAYWYYPEMASRENRLNESVLKINSYGNPKVLLFGNTDSTWTWPDSVVSASLSMYRKNAYNFYATSNEQEVYKDYMENHGVYANAQSKLNSRHLLCEGYELSTANSVASLLTGKSKRGYAAFTNNRTGNLKSLINYITSSKNKNWVRNYLVTYFGPNGTPIQETTSKNIISSARFDKSNLVPTMILEGGGLSSGYFNDYEQQNDHSNDKSHTGKYCSLEGNDQYLGHIVLSPVHNQGILVQFWSDKGTISQIEVAERFIPISFSAEVEGWYRYEIVLPANEGAIGEYLNIRASSTNGDNFHIDDVKIAPYQSKSKLFVYNYKTYQLIANFDEQHFATIYQYTPDGKLVRKRKETLKGIKTIEEQHLNAIEGL